MTFLSSPYAFQDKTFIHFMMKKLTLLFIAACTIAIQAGAQCTNSVEITTYVPGLCYYQSPPFLEATPAIDCTDANFMVIKWKVSGNIISESTTTDFTSPFSTNLYEAWMLGVSSGDVCCEIHIFDNNYQEISISSDCEAEVFIPTAFSTELTGCQWNCFNIMVNPYNGSDTYSVSINGSDSFAMSANIEEYCFDNIGSYEVVATNQFGCTSISTFLVFPNFVDSLHEVTGVIFNDADEDGYWDGITETTAASSGIVTIEELNLTATITEYGVFSFSDIPEGDYTYTYSDPNYNWILSTANNYVHNSISCQYIYFGVTNLWNK
jgi:hypothetical protein